MSSTRSERNDAAGAARPARPWLRLRLLGGCEFLRPDGPVHLETAKTGALLVYLAMQPGPQQRHRLTGLLWGELPEPNARRNLRRALWNLRRQLTTPDAAPLILTTRQTVEFNRQSDYWLDAEAFEKLVEGGTDLREAVKLYRGEFLDGFYVRGAPAFEEWALMERERLRTLASLALQRLVAQCTARGEYKAGILYARRLLALDPWQEEAHRALMRLLALTGQRSAALAQYEECRRLLAQELGLEPLDETTALYERIRETPVRVSFLSPVAHESVHLPFTGRADEHAALVDWWERARCGRGSLALIEGEAGIGKTRLIEEVARHAETQGAQVLYGRCYEFSSGLPYHPIAEALRGYLGTVPAASLGLQEVWWSEIARLLPEVRSAHPNLPEHGPVSGEAARQRLFEAVARFLAGAAAGRPHSPPLCLFLDDLHWADPSTLDLLHYLVRRMAGTPVWIVGAYRPEELAPDHPLVRLRQGLSRDHLVHLLPLEPLSAQAVAEMAQALVGPQTGPALGRFLYRESAGNCFFLAETVESLRERGALQGDEMGRWKWDETAVGQALPTGLRDVILQRVGRLSRVARRLLTVAAVIGRPFDRDLLGSAGDLEADAVEQSLQEWLTRRLVRPAATASDHSPLRYGLAHDKIRAVIYQATPTGQRQTLHRRVGEALEQLHADHLEDLYGELAYHYEQASLPRPALTYLSLAAARATAVHAHQEALSYYDRALALADRSQQEYWQVCLERGRTLHALGRYDEAIAAAKEAVAAWEAGLTTARLAAQAALDLSILYRERREYETARSWAEEARRLAWAEVAGAALREQARAKQALGRIEREQGHLEQAHELFQAALSLFDRLGDNRGVAECLRGLGNTLLTWGQYEQARRHLEEARSLFGQLGDQQQQAACARTIGMAWWRQREYEAARSAYVASLKICRAIGDRLGEAASLNGMGLVAISQGEKEETRRCWEKSVALYRSLGLEKRAASGLHNLGILAISVGDWATAQRHLEESLSLNRSCGAQVIQALDLGWLGRLHLLRGAYEEAGRFLDAALALDQKSGGSEEEAEHLAWRGAVAWETGDLDAARTYLEQAGRLAAQRGTRLGAYETGLLSLVRLACGEGRTALQEVQGALARAEEEHKGYLLSVLGTVWGSGLTAAAGDPVPCFEQALNLLRGQAPLEYGLALRRYGAYLLRHGDGDRGVTCLEEAGAIFERLGAEGERAKIARLLAGERAPELGW